MTLDAQVALIALQAMQQEHSTAKLYTFARLLASQGVQLQGLPPAGVRFAEGHPVGQLLVVGSADVNLELVAGFGVEAGLSVDPGDV